MKVDYGYTLIAYDKDSDVYQELAYSPIYLFVKMKADECMNKLLEGTLVRENGEPFDLVAIYHNYGKDTEKRVWCSE